MKIDAFFLRLYSSPWGRLARRFVVAGASATVSWLVATGKVFLTPDGLVDSILRLTKGDIVFALKLFIGAGFLAAVDKLRREGVWLWAVDADELDAPSLPAPVAAVEVEHVVVEPAPTTVDERGV